jgi:hypothetical protein
LFFSVVPLDFALGLENEHEFYLLASVNCQFRLAACCTFVAFTFTFTFMFTCLLLQLQLRPSATAAWPLHAAHHAHHRSWQLAAAATQQSHHVI